MPSLDTILSLSISRRKLLGVAGTTATLSILRPHLAMAANVGNSTVLNNDYKEHILIRWGDPITNTAPAFNPSETDPEKTKEQFGYNNDYIAFFTIDENNAILCVNHEYPDTKLMHRYRNKATAKNMVQIEMLSVGISVIQITKNETNIWEIVKESGYNRRINATDTVCILSGPAAGHERLQTASDPTGTFVIGTLANCGGGVTPWNTFLSGEENFDHFFYGSINKNNREYQNHNNFGIAKGPLSHWAKHDKRFDITAEPNEPNRFGWIVEVNPWKPDSPPVKRTALGRMKHEYATAIKSESGYCVIYLSDDEANEHLYKFISSATIDTENSNNNRDILDDGVLYVAKFYENGDVRWLPLIFGQGQLTEANGFYNQGDVMIDTRKSAKLLDATPMDRPEGIAIHPKTGAIYISLTKNPKKQTPQPANPNAPNPLGHILTINTKNHESLRDTWDIFVLGTKKTKAKKNAGANNKIPYNTNEMPFANPDNLTFTNDGTLWVATDGMNDIGSLDRLYSLKQHENEVILDAIYQAPIGAETCAPTFSTEQKTLFLSVQHPAKGSSPIEPSTKWPDFDPVLPPRPSVIMLIKK